MGDGYGNVKLEMRRYWLFGSTTYYATGGMCDFLGSYDSPGEAVIKGETDERRGKIDWWHVLDSHAGEIAARSDDVPYGFEEFPDFKS